MRAASLSGSLLTPKGCAHSVKPNILDSTYWKEVEGGMNLSRTLPEAVPTAIRRRPATTSVKMPNSRSSKPAIPIARLTDLVRRNAPEIRPKRDRRVRLSVRLDPVRHLQLKLASAHTGKSLQNILIDALDEHIGRAAPKLRAGTCTCFGAQGGSSPAKPSGNSD
jgi:hypothetical protein